MDEVATREDVRISLQRSDDKIKLNEENLRFILTHDPEWKGRIWFDELNREVRLDGEVPGDHVAFDAATWISREYNLDFPSGKIDRAIDAVGMAKKVHPVREWLKSLVWDGEERLDRWLVDYCGVEDKPLHRAYGRRWMIQCVMRGFRPGCQADSALIFYSAEQGLRKSTTFRVLAGSEWFSDQPIDIGHDQKQGMALRGSWIHELAEMASLRKKDQDAVKQFLTIKWDKYRAPYGRRMLVHPRTTCFCGTTNSMMILSDPTGSRRFWVVKVGQDGQLKIALLGAYREQLWAEAVHMVQTWCDRESLELDELAELPEELWFERTLRAPDEVRWWLTDEEEESRRVDVDAYTRVDPILDELQVLIGKARWYTNRQLLAELEIDVTRNPGIWARLGPLLGTLGWERWRRKGVRGWKSAGTETPKAQDIDD